MGTILGGPHNKDYNILGSILGSPYFGKLPDECVLLWYNMLASVHFMDGTTLPGNTMRTPSTSLGLRSLKDPRATIGFSDSAV